MEWKNFCLLSPPPSTSRCIAKRLLTQLGSRVPPQRRKELCEDLLGVFGSLDPGLSQSRWELCSIRAIRGGGEATTNFFLLLRGLTILELLRARLDLGDGAEASPTPEDLLEEATGCLRVEAEGSLSRRRLAELQRRMMERKKSA